MDTIRCPGCGNEVPDGHRLCGYCGTPLVAPQAVACPTCTMTMPGSFRYCGWCATPLRPGVPPVWAVAPWGWGQAGGGPWAAGSPPGTAAGAPAAPGFVPPPMVVPPGSVPTGAPGAPSTPVGPGAASGGSAAALPPQEIRKIVTIIFSDLKGSTALTERIDAEAINEVKERYFSTMAAEIERHGGKIEKYIGDAIMAVFGLPRAHEDDALRAVRAAAGMQRALRELNEDLDRIYGVTIANRTGVNTGEVVANVNPDADQRLATGDAVNVAARLEQAAPADEILIGEVTYDLVRAHVEVEPVDPLELKGKAERVPAYRLVAIRDSPVDAVTLAADAPLVGRETQFDELKDTLRDAVSSGGCRLVTVLGEAGVGKSHLVDTFVREVGTTVTVLRGRCLPYGDGITFWPLLEVARGAAGIAEDDTPDDALRKLAAPLGEVPGAADILDRVASVIGLSATRYPVAEIFWGARKYLEVLAARRPVVVVFEDIHYAEPTFLDLLEHLRDTTGRQAAVMVVGTARLDLLDKRAEWGAAGTGVQVTMAPLGPADTGRLVEVLLGGPVSETVKERIVGAASGNPLFVSQLVSMFVDKGLIHREDGAWDAAGDLATVAVPPTIQALLASRLDDLSREERAIMEPAAVIGLAFPQPAVAELVPDALRASVPGHLANLDRKQFVGRDATIAGEDEIYRFRNLLIRDATYGSLLKRARAQMHERFVAWAERVNKERGREQEFEEILGYHLEQAYRYRTELGPVDDAARTIAERGAAKLSAAGRRAFGRGDLPAAISLLRRAAGLTPDTQPARVELLAEVAEALVAHGAFEDAGEVLDEAGERAQALADPRLDARVAVIRLLLGLYVASEESSASSSIEQAKALISTLEPLDDDAGLARAWRIVMANEFTLGRLSEAAEAADQVVEHATRAGDQRLAGRSAPAIAYVLVQGPTPVTEAIPRCEELLASVRGDRMNEAIVLSALAQLQAMTGAPEEARALYQRGQAILDELGGGIAALSTSIDSARVELRAGDLARAEAELRRDEAALAAIDEAYFRSTIAAMLANVLCARGAYDEADRFATLAAELADEDDVSSQVAWRMARAKVLADHGDAEAAEAMATEAAGLANDTEDLALRVDTLEDQAMVLAALGRHNDAAPPLREALALCEAKGDRAGVGQLRRRLEELAATA